jgi:hypothetical protein
MMIAFAVGIVVGFLSAVLLAALVDAGGGQ